jgi:hypothetical protein
MKRPVFVVGCPRSGTTLMYSMLVGAGGFAFYRKETYFYDQLPRFPELNTPTSRARFKREFTAGYLGKVPGLDVEPLVAQSLEQCRRPAEFLPLLMAAVTKTQQMDRWVEGTPVHVLHMDAIKRDIPDALFLHVIRDGRDCALSMARQPWNLKTWPWDASRRVGVAALFWEWMVKAGRAFGTNNARDYLEVRFEDLVTKPRTTLDRIGRFIDHDLTLDRIIRNRVEAIHRPNTSFSDEAARERFSPVGRWLAEDVRDDAKLCERLVGPYLKALGYTRAWHDAGTISAFRVAWMRWVYLNSSHLKHWIKTNTLLGRFVTSDRVWREQPPDGQPPVRPIFSSSDGEPMETRC